MNFYLIQHRKKSVVLYTEGERTPLESPDSTKSLVDQWVDWLTRRGTRARTLFQEPDDCCPRLLQSIRIQNRSDGACL